MAITKTITTIANANQSRLMGAVVIADAKRTQNDCHVGEHSYTKSVRATSQVGAPNAR
jgi:hypothetical protein